MLDNNIYLFFYDLDYLSFCDMEKKLSNYMNIAETRMIKIGRENYFLIFGCLYIQKIEELIMELDSMDIGEFEIAEYSNKQGVINSFNSFNKTKDKNFSRQIYINKDERIIQIYNF